MYPNEIMSNHTFTPFSELIRSEEELLRRLLVVSQRQMEIVSECSETVLLEHLGLRHKLWNEIELVEEQLAPYKGIPPEKRVWKSVQERQLTESALNQCKDLMEKIMANDQISLARAAARRDEVAAQLRRVQQSTVAVPAYVKQSQLQR